MIIDIEILPLAITIKDLEFVMGNKKAIFDPIFKPLQKEVVIFIQRESL